MPVDGPARCTSTITIGNSIIELYPINSCISDKPGPDVAVIALLPEKVAPTAAPSAAISSSA